MEFNFFDFLFPYVVLGFIMVFGMPLFAIYAAAGVNAACDTISAGEVAKGLMMLFVIVGMPVFLVIYFVNL